VRLLLFVAWALPRNPGWEVSNQNLPAVLAAELRARYIQLSRENYVEIYQAGGPQPTETSQPNPVESAAFTQG
jgi:hypothetical protein